MAHTFNAFEYTVILSPPPPTPPPVQGTWCVFGCTPPRPLRLKGDVLSCGSTRQRPRCVRCKEGPLGALLLNMTRFSIYR